MIKTIFERLFVILFTLMLSYMVSVENSYAFQFQDTVTCSNVYDEDMAVISNITTDMLVLSTDRMVLVRADNPVGPYYVVDTEVGWKVGNGETWTAIDYDAPMGCTLYYQVYIANKSVGEGAIWSSEKYCTYSPKTPYCEYQYYYYSDIINVPQFTEATTTKNLFVKLVWTRVETASGYNLYTYDDLSHDYVLLKTINEKYTTFWTDKDIEPGQNKKYKVSSFKIDHSGNIVESELSDFIELSPVPNAPILKLRVVGTKSIKLSWDKIDNADGYVIYAYNDDSKKYKKIKTITSGDTTSWKNTNLTTGKKRTYKITSYVLDSEGKKIESVKSEKKSATPRANKYTEKADANFYDNEYGEVILRNKEVSYVNGKIQYKALALNNRVFTANKFDWIEIKIYDDDKLLAKQKFYNKYIGLGAYKSKTMTFVFDKGTKISNHNLRYADIDVVYEYLYSYNY